MKLSRITTSPNFLAGKVHIYSDFDGTYFPVSHSSLHIEGENTYLNEYCKKMDNFFKSTENDLHFHITTGRTFGEYEAVSNLLKMKGFHLPLPESFIAKNGSDEYIKIESNDKFYSNGVFPYKYSEPNMLKEEQIKVLTNWNGKKIKDFIRNLADKYHLRFIEAISEHSIRNYGSSSFFSEGKLDADEWKKLPNKNGQIQEHKVPIADYSIGSRKDGNLKVNLVFPPDYGYCPKRNCIYDNFMAEIKQFLKNNNIDYAISRKIPSERTHYRNHYNITPRINNSTLTKLYDTKEALKKAVTDNDLVVVAGDGSNDFEMLNPLEYIEENDWQKYGKHSTHKDFYYGDMQTKLSLLKNTLNGHNPELMKELETNGFIKQIQTIPLYGIIIKKEDSKLQELYELFGRFGKIISIEKGKLDEGIKDAIKKYSENSEKFKNSMSSKFKNYIFDITEKKDYKKISVILSICLLSAGTAIYFIKKLKQQNKLPAENTGLRE